MTVHEAVLNVGLFLGTALGGWVSQSWSMLAAFALAGGAMVLLTLAQLAVYRWFVCKNL
jgi:predicted MFS family arabinose efflux permease